MLGEIIFSILPVALGIWTIDVLAWWNLFLKAGEKGWKALIPFYIIYTELKLTWSIKASWIYVGAGTAVLVLVWFLVFLLSDPSSSLGFTFIGIVFFLWIFVLVVSVMSVIRTIKLGLSFGKGPAFIVGLMFLNSIFLLIMAFDSSAYLGPGGKPEAEDRENQYS